MRVFFKRDAETLDDLHGSIGAVIQIDEEKIGRGVE